MDLSRVDNTVSIENTKYYVEHGLLTRTSLFQYQAMPTKLTEPDTVYRVVVSNGVLEWEDKVFWNKLELDISKPKIIKHQISRDEYKALSMNPWYATEIYEVHSENSFNYLMMPIAFTGVIIIIRMAKKEQTNYFKQA